MAILAWLLSLLSGPLVGQVLGAFRAKLDAQTEHDKIQADVAMKAIEAEIDTQREARAILIAEQGRWYTAIVRPLFALPFVIYINKLVLWDKVMGLGSTDPLSPELWQLCMTIIGAYFIGRSAEKIASTITQRK
ncbi:hypothetical protein [Xanthobacter versatilis]|uniref:hypothetical protein n=1 Tax=Xanthobacter autotrophicus (strain ATCC BAA-1158 / Py2) TaxID=78245 RepID=UPI00372C0BE6